MFRIILLKVLERWSMWISFHDSFLQRLWLWQSLTDSGPPTASMYQSPSILYETVEWHHDFLLRTLWTISRKWIKSQRLRFSVLCTQPIFVKTHKITCNCTLKMHKVGFIIKFFCNHRTDSGLKRVAGLISNGFST